MRDYLLRRLGLTDSCESTDRLLLRHCDEQVADCERPLDEEPDPGIQVGRLGQARASGSCIVWLNDDEGCNARHFRSGRVDRGLDGGQRRLRATFGVDAARLDRLNG